VCPLYGLENRRHGSTATRPPRRRLVLPVDIYPVDPWRIVERRFCPRFERLLAEQERRVEAFWDTSDVEIEGEPDVQQSVRFNLFQVMQASARVYLRGVNASIIGCHRTDNLPSREHIHVLSEKITRR